MYWFGPMSPVLCAIIVPAAWEQGTYRAATPPRASHMKSYASLSALYVLKECRVRLKRALVCNTSPSHLSDAWMWALSVVVQQLWWCSGGPVVHVARLLSRL